jgi:hypothetical protein
MKNIQKNHPGSEVHGGKMPDSGKVARCRRGDFDRIQVGGGGRRDLASPPP